MRARAATIRTATAVAVTSIAAALASTAPATAAPATAGPVTSGPARADTSRHPAGVVSDFLDAIAVTAPDAIWAAGTWHGASDSEQPLVQRWNGQAWKLVPSPSPAGSTADNELIGMATITPTRAWLAGTYWDGTNWQTLIQHWNGTAWKRVASPDPGGPSNRNILNGIAVTSRSSAWAVGYYNNGGPDQTLIEHWNGKAWTKVASPSPGGTDGSELQAVAAVSPSSVWAVGFYSVGPVEQTLILHWNGKTWRHVASPTPNPQGCTLDAVAPAVRSTAWAVGSCSTGAHSQTLTLHWNGAAWMHVASPNPGGSARENELTAVVPVSRSSAWAFGYYFGNTTSDTVIEHWNGTTWKPVASPSTGHGGRLLAAAAVSPSSIWAVGGDFTGGTEKTLIEHWNGKSWRRIASPNR